MKAAITDGHGNLEVRQIEMPVMTTPYDVLCENLYCSTCVGTDLHIINGRSHVPVSYPTILGHESIARVVETGSKVRSFKPGDLITRVGYPPTEHISAHWGGFSEFGIARDHESMKLDGLDMRLWTGYRVNMRVPEGLITPMDATMIITWRETLSFVKRMCIGKGSRVLISGSGANGISIGSFAHIFGADEVVLVGSPKRRKNALSAGFDEVIPYNEAGELERFIEEKRGYYDFLIDATGKAGAINRLLGCLRANGIFSCYGRDDCENYAVNPFRVGASFSIYAGGYDENEAHEAVIDLIRQGRLISALWLEDEYSLADIKHAYEDAKKRRFLKAAIRIK